MKPTGPGDSGARRGFPRTDYCFQSGLDGWHGFFSPNGGEGSRFHNFRKLNHQLLAQAAREHVTEMIVFSLIVGASAWLVIYMVVTVVTLLSKGHP